MAKGAGIGAADATVKEDTVGDNGIKVTTVTLLDDADFTISYVGKVLKIVDKIEDIVPPKYTPSQAVTLVEEQTAGRNAVAAFVLFKYLNS